MTQAAARSWPLTPLQLGMLHESLLSERTSVNLEQVACHLDDEAFDPTAMKRAWEALTQRHEVLRSVYAWRDDRAPSQDVAADAPLEWAVHDLRALSPVQQQEALDAWRAADRQRGVLLDVTPNWRLTWFRWEDRRSTLYWTFHHIMLDGSSIALLLQEALEAYSALQQGLTPESAPLSELTFADYCVALQALRHQEEAQASAQRFFEAQLHGVSADQPLEALGRPPQPMAEDMGAGMGSVRASLASTDMEQLQALARASDATLGTVVQVAWGVLLSRMSGQRDVVFGVVRAGRHIVPGAQDTVGCLINTLPVRVKVEMGVSIDQLLRDMRRYMLGMRPHEHLFLGDLQAWSDVFTGQGHLNSVVMFEPWPLERRLRELGGPWLQRRFEVHEEGAADMTLAAYVREGLDLELEFDRDRLDAGTAERLMASLLTLLRQMALASGDQTVASLDMLTPLDRRRLQALAVPEGGLKASSSCAMALFARTVRRRPSAVALSVLGQATSLTYAELDARSSRLAHWLRGQGVEEGDRVAICMSRGPDFVVAMLATMKADAAYVPIDPAYPAEVKQHMASDSGAVLMLASAEEVSAPRMGRTVVLHSLAQELAGLPSEWSDPLGQGLDRPAYVIYTSGSTGQPKGVVVGQHALVAHAAAVTAAYGLHEDDRVLQFASLSFDVSIEEIVPTLLAGAELVLRDAAVAESVSALWAAVQARQLTVLNLPTAYWHTCVDQLELGQASLPACVRLVVVGGEKASRQALTRWRSAVPDCRWINGYGPTEATITCTWYEALAHKPLPAEGDIPIGRPLAHARAYVVAADGSLAPPGVRGELCLGGPCLAMGYHGQLEMTAQRFMATVGLDPVWEDAHEPRIYRTGDLASWGDDGELHYHGRADRQVKVRGFRVELEAVEEALAALPGVGRAVVKVDQPNTPAARLLAWVIPEKPGQVLALAELQSALAARLPEHMRPRLSVIESLPITPGGKIDYRQLVMREQPELEADSQSGDLPLPEDLRRMTALFARVLKRKKMAPDASFFDMGGNSLLAVGLIGRIESEFHRPVTTGLLKLHPTPMGMLDAMDSPSLEQGPRHLVPIQEGGRAAPIYGIHGLGHRERLFRPLARCLGPDQPVYGVTIGYQGLQDKPLSVPELAGLYLKDIELHRPNGPLVLAGLSHSGYVAFELAQQLVKAGRTVSHLVLFDTEGPGGRAEVQGRMKRLGIHWTHLRRRGSTYLVEKLARRLTGMGGVASKAGFLLARATGFLGGLEFDHPADVMFIEQLDAAVVDYRPAPYWGRVTVFYPLNDPFLDREVAEQTALGWRACCTGELEVVAVPGEHTSMLTEPYVRDLASAIQERIRRSH
jgi:amino acid adenylation domain-containing protein